jgi:hypothetical protein
MNHYVTVALTNRKSSVHLHALYSPRTALRMFTPRRDYLMVCLLYMFPNKRQGRNTLIVTAWWELCVSIISFVYVTKLNVLLCDLCIIQPLMSVWSIRNNPLCIIMCKGRLCGLQVIIHKVGYIVLISLKSWYLCESCMNLCLIITTSETLNIDRG